MQTYFHGSPFKFKKFTLPKSGKDYGIGIYLTLDQDEATQYALGSEENGYLYRIRPLHQNPFNVTDKGHSAFLKMAIRKHSLNYVENEDSRFSYIKDPGTGFDQSMSYSLYHQVRSSFGLDHIDSADINLILLEAGFDSILDPIKGWLIVFRPESLKIISSDRLRIKQYDFCGKPGEMKFVKRTA